MGVIASRFTEVMANSGKPAKGDIQVNTNLPVLTTMKCVAVGEGKQKKDLLVVGFEYNTTYHPMGAKIELKGELTYVSDDAKKILAMWTKDKKMTEKDSVAILNYLIKKCSVQCIKIADDLQLPVPISLPEVRAKEVKK
jgi:hypothetical protein